MPSGVTAVDRLRDSRITCASSGRGHIFLGDAEGTVHLIDKQLVLNSFRAYETSLCHMIQVPQTTFLVTAGSDDATLSPIIRFFNLDKWSSHPDGRKPLCTREIRCSSSATLAEVSCLAAAESLTYLVVGFTDGTLIIHKGDVSRERQSKQITVKVPSSPITGIEFGNVNVGPNQSTTIFVATAHQVLSYTVRKDRETRIVLDDNAGSSLMCSCLIHDQRRKEKLFVVGRKDAVYFFQSDERGPCFAFEGEKEILMSFRDYLIVVGKEKSSGTPFSRSSQSFESQQSVEASPSPATTTFGDYNKISIYDLQNKFVAYSSPIPPVQVIVSEWGMLYMLAKDGRLFQLSEKDISSKLEVLFRKNQFSLASELAQSYNYGAEQLAEISKRYADHLYKNGDYETAIAQYSKTIGVLEPSYVIRKFLDSSRIHNLTFYLQQLIKNKLGNEDHTTLLINCFAKLKDDAELGKLMAQASEFDVDTAIKVLRRAGFFDHAAQLAAMHSKYDAYFQIQLKERNDVATALQFLLQDVRERDQLAILIKYGRILMSKEPQRTTDLVKKITSRYLEEPSSFSLSVTSDSLDLLSPSLTEFDIDDLLNIFVQNMDAIINFIEYLIEKQASKTPPTFYNTILALLMRSFNSSSSQQKREISDKIMRILQNGDANYDMDHALVLCAAHSFDKGLLYLYRKSKSYRLLQQHFIQKKDADNVVECCTEFGAEDPQLWVQALYFFRDNEPTSERQVATVVSEIEKLHLMQPLTVIDTLSLNQRLPLSCIREYMVRFLTTENEMIAENDKMILQVKDETEKMKQAIDDLKTSPRTFQAAKCSGCSKSLDVPSVHFYCGHSYHQSCFESYSAEHDSECPICLPENTKLLNLIQYRKSVKDLSQKLRLQLGRADSDPMTVVSSFLSKGVFGAENL